MKSYTACSKCLARILLAALAILFSPGAGSATERGLPLWFVPNQDGAPAAGYSLRHGGFAADFCADRMTFRIGSEMLAVRYSGPSAELRIEPGQRYAGVVNYLFGNQPETWRTNVPTYGSIAYRGLYPGVDLSYAAEGTTLKSEYRVAPGAALASIRWSYQGAKSVRVDADGSLVVSTRGAEIRERKPEVYQLNGEKREPVEASFRLYEDGSVGFQTGPFDHSRTLVIDPVLTYSTYLGGAGLDAVRAIAVDAAGNAYVAGYTDSSNFPVASPMQSAKSGGVDAFVAKLNPAGTALVYCTYLGGRSDDRAFGIAVDSSAGVYLTGWTYSTNFPTTSGGLQRTLGGGRDAFVVKLNASASALVYGTYLGGSAHDSGNAIAIDSSDNAYVAGDTYSTNFPVLGSYQGTNAGRQDAFASKLNAAGSSLVWSTYMGGYGDESAAAVAVDASGNVYLAGATTSTNFPTSAPLQSVNGGGQDAFVTKINSSGASLAFSTYLGGSGGTVGAGEAATGIGLDSGGNVYIAGYTSSTNFPTVSAYQATHRGGTLDGFLSKLNPSASALVYSTYFGGSSIDYINALGVTSAGSATVAGYSGSSNLPMVAAVQETKSGGYDAFITRFTAAGNSVEFSSYLGGSDSDAANAVAVDSSGSIWIAGQTLSTNFPLKNAIQALNAGGYSGFVTKIGESTPTAAFRSTAGNAILTSYGSLSLANAYGYITSAAAVAQNSRGDSFVSGRNDTTCVYLNIYTYATQSWLSGWVRAGCSMYGDPAVAGTAAGDAYVVARDASYSYWISHYTPGVGFGSWAALGGAFATDPVMVRAPNGTLYLVARSASGIVSSGRYVPGSGFLGWVQAPSTPLATGKPAITIGSDGAAYVAIRAQTGNSVWMARLVGDTWGSWISGGGQAKTDPEVAAAGGYIHASVTNVYDQVYVQAFQEGTGNGWQGWQNLNGVLTKASMASAGGRYYVAGKNGSGTLYWYRQGTGWSYIGYTGLPSSELSASPK